MPCDRENPGCFAENVVSAQKESWTQSYSFFLKYYLLIIFKIAAGDK